MAWEGAEVHWGQLDLGGLRILLLKVMLRCIAHYP
jgi:hypothetical protein